MSTRLANHGKLRRGLFWFAITTLLLLALAAGGILFDFGLRAQISALGTLVLLFLFVISVFTALATTEVIPWHDLSFDLLRQPKILSTIAGILLMSFGTLASFLPLLDARGGTEAAIAELGAKLTRIDENTEAIRQEQEEINDALRDRGIIRSDDLTLVEKHIGGIWGQSDCANTYRFALDPAGGQTRTLNVDALKSAPDLDPYVGRFTFKSASDQFGNDGFARSILSTQETEGFNPGYSVDFTLVSTGESETLIWGSASAGQSVLELIRCTKGTAE